MDFDDGKILTPNEYLDMAKAYAQDLKNHGFVFLRLNYSQSESALKELLDTMMLQKSNLFALGGFLGTGNLYSLNEQQIKKIQQLFGTTTDYKKTNFYKDKTKCFLNMLSLESLVISKMLNLALNSSHFEDIISMIKERTSLAYSLFKINGIISSSIQ